MTVLNTRLLAATSILKGVPTVVLVNPATKVYVPEGNPAKAVLYLLP
jgi:hypothetical protein